MMNKKDWLEQLHKYRWSLRAVCREYNFDYRTTKRALEESKKGKEILDEIRKNRKSGGVSRVPAGHCMCTFVQPEKDRDAQRKAADKAGVSWSEYVRSRL